jgi:hypothetical protein
VSRFFTVQKRLDFLNYCLDYFQNNLSKKPNEII